MKTVIILTTLVTFTSTSTVPASGSLREDLQDFLALIPIDDLTSLAFDYYLHDEEVQDAFAYMHGEEFSVAWDQLFALKEVKDLLNYLEDGELEVYDALNIVADFLGLNHIKPNHRAVQSFRIGGLNGFLEDAITLLPIDKLAALFEKKVNTSPKFKALFQKLQHFDFRKLVDLHNDSKEIQALFQKLRERNIDVDYIVELVAGFFGWGYLR